MKGPFQTCFNREDLHDQDGEKIVFQTSLGRKIFDAVYPKPKPKTNENFFPGRMFFRFELDEDFGSDLPTNVIRSKTEYNEYQVSFPLMPYPLVHAISISSSLQKSKMAAPTSDLVVNKIIDLMSNIRKGARAVDAPKKSKKKERQGEIGDDQFHPFPLFKEEKKGT